VAGKGWRGGRREEEEEEEEGGHEDEWPSSMLGLTIR